MKLESFLFSLFILVNACNQKTVFQSYAYTQPAMGKCGADTLNAYHFVLPDHHSGNIPLLIILDSGGDGLLAIEKFKPAVSRIPCMVMGSDLVRNNYPSFEKAIGVLLNEAVRKFHVSKDQVYIAGFSGGARMAFEYARVHPVKGVLMCGAGPAGVSFKNLPCPVYLIAGTTDFNFSEMYYNPLKKSGQPGFMADYFRGSHEWPPAEALKEGLLFLMGKSFPEGQELLKRESVFLSEKADSLLDREEMLFAVKSVEKAIHFDLHNKTARQKIRKMMKNREVAIDINRMESDLELEGRMKQTFFNAVNDRDSIWWANELRQLSQEIDNSVGETKDHYLRMKGFLGILFFSQLNNIIHAQPGNRRIPDLLAAYRMAEPKNPDVYYYSALYALKKGSEKECRHNLNLALSLGFKDRDKMEQDFPRSILNLQK
jgi:hypothetical protein